MCVGKLFHVLTSEAPGSSHPLRNQHSSEGVLDFLSVFQSYATETDFHVKLFAGGSFRLSWNLGKKSLSEYKT